MPCYNEIDAIEDTILKIQRAIDICGSGEIIIVDDGSTDGSDDALRKNSADNIRVFFHEINRGYGAALKTGIRRANSDLIVIADADGTYPIDQIPMLVDKIENADMVVGARTGSEVDYPFVRKIPKLFLSFYSSWIAGRKIPDINSGLRVFRKSVAEKYLHILPNSFSFTTTITLALMTNDYHVEYVPINYAARIGKSKIRPISDTLRFFQLIIRTGIYFAPIRALTPLISLMAAGTIFSFFYDIFVKENLTDTTIILLMFTLNTVLFALIADMIDKRSGK